MEENKINLEKHLIEHDALGVRENTDARYVNVSGDTMTGALSTPSVIATVVSGDSIKDGIASITGGNIIVGDNGTIGSVSDPDIMTLAVDGTATFSVFPVTPSVAPDANYEVANKKYVDDNAGGTITSGDLVGLGHITIGNGTGKVLSSNATVTVASGDITTANVNNLTITNGVGKALGSVEITPVSGDIVTGNANNLVITGGVGRTLGGNVDITLTSGDLTVGSANIVVGTGTGKLVGGGATVDLASTPSVTGLTASGQISGDTVIAVSGFTGALSGNATTATTLATARAINGVDFDGSAPITVTADANTLSNTTLKSTVVTSSLTAVGTIASLVATTADINAGTFDGIVGGTTPAAGSFTTLVADTLNGNTLIVSPNSAYTTITLAMAAAVANDTILVAEGTYTETVTFSQDNITLKAIGSKENTIITQAAASAVDLSTKSGCFIEGFTINVTAATSNAHACVTSANDDTTDYNHIINCDLTRTSATALNPARCIWVTDGNLHIFNCKINNDGNAATGTDVQSGIQTSTAAGILDIEHCKFNIDCASTGGYAFGIRNRIGSTINVRDCEITVNSAATLGYVAGVEVLVTAGVTSVYNSKLVIDNGGGTGATHGLYSNMTGDIINSYNNVIDSTNAGSGEENWAKIVSGATLNSAGDTVLDGTLSNSGTFNIKNTAGINTDTNTTNGLYTTNASVLSTTKHHIHAYSNVANVAADAALVKIHQDHASATEPALEILNDGTAHAIEITQTAVVSTNFKKVISLAGFTIWVSDGTTAAAALTGAEGDICLNGGTGAGQTAFCNAAGTNWTDM